MGHNYPIYFGNRNFLPGLFRSKLTASQLPQSTRGLPDLTSRVLHARSTATRQPSEALRIWFHPGYAFHARRLSFSNNYSFQPGGEHRVSCSCIY